MRRVCVQWALKVMFFHKTSQAPEYMNTYDAVQLGNVTQATSRSGRRVSAHVCHRLHCLSFSGKSRWICV